MMTNGLAQPAIDVVLHTHGTSLVEQRVQQARGAMQVRLHGLVGHVEQRRRLGDAPAHPVVQPQRGLIDLVELRDALGTTSSCAMENRTRAGGLPSPTPSIVRRPGQRRPRTLRKIRVRSLAINCVEVASQVDRHRSLEGQLH